MGHAPENTLVGFREAAARGAAWVEFDVKLSADDVPIVYHDDTLERTTGVRGAVRKRDFAELSRLDAGSWFDPAFAEESVPSLAQTLEVLAELGLGANLEIKPSPRLAARTTELALAEVVRLWPASLPAPLVSSFKRQALMTAQRLAPDLPRALNALQLPRDWRDAVRSLGCESVHLWHEKLKRDTVRAIKAEGYALAVFTVNDPVEARRFVDWGVDCVITDVPDVMLAAL
jgi:glycerophosphoryl diester phosphodiesterase